MMEILQPPHWERPHGYSNGVATRGKLIFVSGQIGWDEKCQFHSDDFSVQARQALKNIVAILAEAGGKPEHIVRMTWYVVDKREYLKSHKETGEAYREIIGRHFPAMSAVQVSALMEDRAKIEIETTAVIPERA